LPLVALRDPIVEARRQWAAHGWDDVADGMAALTSVMRAQQLLLARCDAVLADFELTFARFELLRLLAFTRHGELPLGKAGARLQVHPASVTNAVDRLAADGLVERVPHPTDGRGVLARITDHGRDVVDAATDRLNAEVFAHLGLSQTESRRLTALLTKVRVASGDDGSGRRMPTGVRRPVPT
jgi:DNA-binding MarR family transcriptional regulator